MSSPWEIVIGLEVHVQLKTRTKLFCGCLNKYGADPNTLVCPICLGLPGVLPVLNRQAFALAVRAGVALGCEVAGVTKFDRKNYYYPDLPKGYQISQYDRPLNSRGRLEVETPAGKKNIGITRIHLEEDAGKLIHPDTEGSSGVSFVDLNRAGVPLAEIVSEPDMRSPDEAYAYLTALKEILQYVDISDCDMEKGSLRCDANVSIRRPGDEKLGVKTEIKNLNSFKSVAKALQYEANRHAEIIEGGGKVQQVTLNWDAVAEKTVILRSKEEAHDYRYFPEPDLVHINADAAFVERIRQALPEKPAARRDRYVKDLGLPAYDAGVLTGDKELAALFDKLRGEGLAPKVASNWVMNFVLAVMNELKLHTEHVLPHVRRIAEAAKMLERKEITKQIARSGLTWILKTNSDEEFGEYIRSNKLEQVDDPWDLVNDVRRALESNKKAVEDYRGGKKVAVKGLIGTVMKLKRGTANAVVVERLLVGNLEFDVEGKLDEVRNQLRGAIHLGVIDRPKLEEVVNLARKYSDEAAALGLTKQRMQFFPLRTFALTGLGKFEDARRELEEMETQSKELHENMAVSLSQDMIGVTHALEGNYSKALPYFERAIKLADQLDYIEGLIRAKYNEACTLLASGNQRAALTTLRSATAVDENRNWKFHDKTKLDNYFISAWSGICQISLELGDFAACEEAFNMVNRIMIQVPVGDFEFHFTSVAAAVGNMGIVKLRLGRHLEAITLFERAQELFSRIGEARKAALAGELLTEARTSTQATRSREIPPFHSLRLEEHLVSV